MTDLLKRLDLLPLGNAGALTERVAGILALRLAIVLIAAVATICIASVACAQSTRTTECQLWPCSVTLHGGIGNSEVAAYRRCHR
jgi:hypothetical protein